MKITTIQVYEDTKRKLEQIKQFPSESYDAILKRVLDNRSIPSLEEMFYKADNLPKKKVYSIQKTIQISHELRGKR